MRLPKGFVKDDDIRFIYNIGGGSMLDMGCESSAKTLLSLRATNTDDGARLYYEHTPLFRLSESHLGHLSHA